MSVNYMEYVVRVVERVVSNAVDVDRIGRSILSVWNDLEDAAAIDKYDIFTENSYAIAHARLLLTLLYQVPGAIDEDDAEQLAAKDREYGGSWCRRGGTGAFHMAARKADRIAHQLSKTTGLKQALDEDRRVEGIRDDLGDLRRYLILWMAWKAAKNPAQEGY